MASITPSPRWRSSSPSRTRSGSHAPASTVPSRRTATGAVTTGRQNTASSPGDSAAPPAVTVPSPRTCRSAARTTTVPDGVPAFGDTSGRIASATEGRQDCTRDSCDRRGFDTQRLPGVPLRIQNSAKYQVTALHETSLLKSVVLGRRAGRIETISLVSAGKFEHVHTAVSFLCQAMDPPYVVTWLVGRNQGGLKRFAPLGTSQPKMLGNKVFTWARTLRPAPEDPPWWRLQALPMPNLLTFGWSWRGPVKACEFPGVINVDGKLQISSSGLPVEVAA